MSALLQAPDAGRLYTASRDKTIRAWPLADFSAQLAACLLNGDKVGAAAAVAAGALQPSPTDWLDHAGVSLQEGAAAQRLLASVLAEVRPRRTRSLSHSLAR